MRVVANDRYWRVTRSDDANAVADPDVFQILKTGRSDAISRCVDRAARRLKAGGLIATGYRNRQLAGRTLAIKSGIHAERLLASMLFPLSLDDLGKIANAVLFPLESEE